MSVLQYIGLILLSLIAVYTIARLFAKGIIDEIEYHFKSHYKQLQKTKKDGKEIEK